MDKIVEAGSRLFGTQRFHEVRMDDIAVEAGVAKGTLYRYFRDKEELYAGLLARTSQQFMERVRAAVARETGARARLEALVDTVITHFDENPHLMGLIQRGELAHVGDKPFQWNETRSEMFQLIAELFEQ